MSDLEAKIAEWRTRMAAGGLKSSAVLDELESHLREDVERLLRSGAGQEEAFGSAVQNIGRSDLLKAEFAKIGGARDVPLGRAIGTAGCVAAGLYSMVLAPSFVFTPELGPGQRISGLLAIASTLFFLASLRFSYKFLPGIRNRQARVAVVTTCGMAGVAGLLIFANALPNFIVPRFLVEVDTSDSGSLGTVSEPTSGFGYGSMIVHNTASPVSHYRAPHPALKPSRRDEMTGGLSLVWAMTFAAFLGGAAYGLEEAARRRTTENAYV